MSPTEAMPPPPSMAHHPSALTAGPPAPETVLAAERLSVRYGRRLALDGVTFAVAAGTVHALLGRNGAGKSSLVRCLLGAQRPTSGRATLFGADAWSRRAALMADVGVVPEQPNAPPAASARALARLCRPLYPRWDDAGFAARLRRFSVPADLPFGRLSRGQQRQVELALALAPSPRLLLLDDPTLGLDAVARHAFFEELIGELADRGTSVFLTTHDLAAVERIAERVAILDAGRLLVDEDLEILKQRFRRLWLPAAATAVTALAGPAAAALAALEPRRRTAHDWGLEVVVAAYDEGRFLTLRACAPDSRAEALPLSLDEIFVALTGEEAAVDGAR